jgi:Flp pilus assembly protein TadG
VEFALVWFALSLFIIGMIQFGLIFNQWLQLEHSAREGARWAALRNSASYVRTKVTVRHNTPVITPVAEAWFGTAVQMTASATQRVE